MPRTYYFERASGDNTADSERDRLFELTREAEAAERLSLELPSSVLRRVAMIESNLRLVEAYSSASGETQHMVGGAVIERTRRRENILRGHVDAEGRPFDVETDEEADEEIRRELTHEGYVYVANAAGERSYYQHLNDDEVRYLAPQAYSNGHRRALPDRSIEHLVHDDLPPTSAAAVVPQEEDREPVWYFRRAREIAREDAERVARTDRSANETQQLDAIEAEMRAMEVIIATTALSNNRYGSSTPAAVHARQSVRVDLKALLHAAQQKLEEEIDASRHGSSFSEGSYLELTDLLRDMFLCVERI